MGQSSLTPQAAKLYRPCSLQ